MSASKTSPGTKECNKVTWPWLVDLPQPPLRSPRTTFICMIPRVVKITNNKFTLGRSPLSNWILHKRSISRFHAEIRKDDGNWIYCRLASNSDSMNDVLLKRNDEVMLRVNDIITICGDAQYEYNIILETIGNHNMNIDRLMNTARAEMESSQNVLIGLCDDSEHQQQQMKEVRAGLQIKFTDREVLQRLLKACEEETAQLQKEDEALSDSCSTIERKIIDMDLELHDKCRDLHEQMRVATEKNQKLLDSECSNTRKNKVFIPRKRENSEDAWIETKRIKRE